MPSKTHLEKLEALLDEMGVWYEREDRDDTILVSIPADVEGYKNGGLSGDDGVIAKFDIYGNCISFPW